MGRSLQEHGKVLGEMSQGLTLVLERQHGARRVDGPSWTTILTILGGIVTLFVVVIGGLARDVKVIKDETGSLRYAMNGWTSEHDARVMPMNTEQSLGVARNCSEIRQMHPDVKLQDCITPARPGRGSH